MIKNDFANVSKSGEFRFENNFKALNFTTIHLQCIHILCQIRSELGYSYITAKRKNKDETNYSS